MKHLQEHSVIEEERSLLSAYLKRKVALHLFLPTNITEPENLNLILVNDGQDMATMNFKSIIEDLYQSNAIEPIIFVAIVAGEERKHEYGIAFKKDYLGRGDKAANYTSFIICELLPYLQINYNLHHFKEIAFAGFSLGGLSALDIVWNHPEIFKKAGVFSGSLWWRDIDQDNPDYDDDKNRIMIQQIRNDVYKPGLQFFFQCGRLDEAHDRNNNGIIDAIDDTQDVIKELFKKGYRPEDIAYLELDDGKHDVPTWGKAMPVFLKWGWGKRN